MSRKHNDKEMKDKEQKMEMNDENVQDTNEETSQQENELKEKIESLEKEIESLKDSLLRKAAEFENYKRRTENDHLNLLKYAGENVIGKLLPTIDDFERSLKHMNDTKDVQSIKDGLQMVYNKLMKTLQEQGVKTIDAIGKPFDVEYHEAVMQKKDDSVPGHTVLDELEKGYMYKDKVIRHTKVIVSEETAEDTTNSGPEGNSKSEEN